MKYAYTYDDIQIVPKFSDIQSRSDCSLKTRLTRRYNIDVPYVSSPMDTVTEYDMAIAMSTLGGASAVHRFMSIGDQIRIVLDTNPLCTVMSIGVTGDYQERAQELVSYGAKIILLDVAHGNTLQVKNALEWCKKNLDSDVDIIAGNVATYDGAKNLAEWGADSIRVGIGGGCFTPEMEVKTVRGNKKIIDIEIGDLVYTHTGELHPVIDKFEYSRDEDVLIVNGIECTKNHEFYAVHMDIVDLITDENIHSYATWISAEDLTSDYYLIQY